MLAVITRDKKGVITVTLPENANQEEREMTERAKVNTVETKQTNSYILSGDKEKEEEIPTS